MNQKFICKSIRLCRYLYSLGFNKESKFDGSNNEYWVFDKTDSLQNALNFYFSMRKKLKK